MLKSSNHDDSFVLPRKFLLILVSYTLICNAALNAIQIPEPLDSVSVIKHPLTTLLALSGLGGIAVLLAHGDNDIADQNDVGHESCEAAGVGGVS